VSKLEKDFWFISTHFKLFSISLCSVEKLLAVLFVFLWRSWITSLIWLFCKTWVLCRVVRFCKCAR